MSTEIRRLRAYAKKTARELVRAGVPLEGPLVTTYQEKIRREGFLRRRKVSIQEEGPDQPELIGWLLWSHVWKEVELHQSPVPPRRKRDPRLTNSWTITRGWWLVSDGSIDIVDHHVELIHFTKKTHRWIADRQPATDEELTHPDLPWRSWGGDDKKSLLVEYGQQHDWRATARTPGLRLSTALTNLRKAKGTYVQRRS